MPFVNSSYFSSHPVSPELKIFESYAMLIILFITIQICTILTKSELFEFCYSDRKLVKKMTEKAEIYIY